MEAVGTWMVELRYSPQSFATDCFARAFVGPCVYARIVAFGALPPAPPPPPPPRCLLSGDAVIFLLVLIPLCLNPPMCPAVLEGFSTASSGDCPCPPWPPPPPPCDALLVLLRACEEAREVSTSSVKEREKSLGQREPQQIEARQPRCQYVFPTRDASRCDCIRTCASFSCASSKLYLIASVFTCPAPTLTSGPRGAAQTRS